MEGKLTVNYWEVKASILLKYGITEVTLCQKFHSTRKGVEKSYVNLVISLNELANMWLWECETREKVAEKIVVEKFIEGLPPSLKISLREKEWEGAQRDERYTRGLADDISAQKHYGVIRRSELGISGERMVVKGNIERKHCKCGELNILNGSVKERTS